MTKPNVRQHKFVVTYAKKNPNKFGSIKITHIGKPDYEKKLTKVSDIPRPVDYTVADVITELTVSCETDAEKVEDARDDGVPTSMLPQSKRYRRRHMIAELNHSLQQGLNYIARQLSSKGRLYNGDIEVDLWWLAGSTNKISVVMNTIIDDDPEAGLIVEKKLEVTT